MTRTVVVPMSFSRMGKRKAVDNEHLLPPDTIGQSAKGGCAYQDAEQGGRANHALFYRAEIELKSDQRQGNACHEDNHAFKELASRGQPPDTPLHGR